MGSSMTFFILILFYFLSTKYKILEILKEGFVIFLINFIENVKWAIAFFLCQKYVL